MIKGFPDGAVINNPPASAGDTRDAGSIPELGSSPERRERATTPVFLPKKFQGQRSLAGTIQANSQTQLRD